MASNDEFVRLIKESAKRCFSELRSANPEEKFCAFALYSDEGAMTVCPSANTDEYLKKTTKMKMTLCITSGVRPNGSTNFGA